MDSAALHREKAKLRAEMRVRRTAAFDADPEATRKIRDVFDAGINVPDGALVSSYIAQGGEIDPSLIEERLLIKGARLCLPCIEEKGAPLLFRSYVPGDPLRLGVWGIPEPLFSCPALEPDYLLVPLLGFDHEGWRLGQGGGFYDRTLSALRAHRKIVAIGLAFAEQETPQIPVASHDQKLDFIVTEEEFIDPTA